MDACEAMLALDVASLISAFPLKVELRTMAQEAANHLVEPESEE